MSRIQLEAKASIVRKWTCGAYLLEDVPCFCGANSGLKLSDRDRYGLRTSNVICPNCGLVRISPRLTEASYADFYSADYRPLYTGNAQPNERFFRAQYVHGARIRSLIDSRVNPGTVFDIGCGAGGVLMAFQSHNWEVAGVDYGEEYLRYGQNHGVKGLMRGEGKELLALNKKADLIILSHVLEHFLDLKSELHIMRNLLKPDGIVYVELPGIRWLHRSYKGDPLRYLQMAHTYSFTLNTLQAVMQACGFKMIAGNEIIESLFRLSSGEQEHTLSTRSNESSSLVKYLVGVERRRRWLVGSVMASCLARFPTRLQP